MSKSQSRQLKPIMIHATPDVRDQLQDWADAHERSLSESGLIAVRQFLAGGPDAYDKLERKRLEDAAKRPRPADEQVRRFGEWFVTLPTDARETVFWVGEALRRHPRPAGTHPDSTAAGRTKRTR